AIAAERELRGLADLEGDGGGQAGRRRAEERQRLHPGLEIGEGEDRDHPGGRARPLGADRADHRVSVGRAQEGDVEQAGDPHVIAKAALAPQEARVLAPADGGAEILRAHRALLVAGGKDPVEPRRHHGHEETRDGDAGNDAHDGEKDEGDDGGRNGAQVVHETSSLDFLMSRIGGRWPTSAVLSIRVMCVMRGTMSRMRLAPPMAWATRVDSSLPAVRRLSNKPRAPTTMASGLLISWAAAPASNVTARSSAASRWAASAASRSAASRNMMIS